LVLLAVLAVPPMDYTATYDLVCVAIVFPLIVLLGHRDPTGRVGAICRFSGEISYPLYALHWVLWELSLRAFRAMGGKGYPDVLVVTAILLIIAGAWGVLKVYDLPVRRWLRARLVRD
ncbi:MAG: acyltransferase, partial [Caulobacter sp. 35-67-4]